MDERIRALTENLDFIEAKLAETREVIQDMPLVIDYGDGKLRKNPAFDAYNALIRTYNNTLSELSSVQGRNVRPKSGKLVKFERYSRKNA